MVTADASAPQPENWEDFIPETEHVLSPSTGSGYFFAEYMVDAVSQVKQYNYKGELVRDIGITRCRFCWRFLVVKKEAKDIYFSFTNYTTPGTIYKFAPENGTYVVYQKPDIDFDTEAYESKQVFYPSKDGTKIPMIITHKKGD